MTIFRPAHKNPMTSIRTVSPCNTKRVIKIAAPRNPTSKIATNMAVFA